MGGKNLSLQDTVFKCYSATRPFATTIYSFVLLAKGGLLLFFASFPSTGMEWSTAVLHSLECTNNCPGEKPIFSFSPLSPAIIHPARLHHPGGGPPRRWPWRRSGFGFGGGGDFPEEEEEEEEVAKRQTKRWTKTADFVTGKHGGGGPGRVLSSAYDRTLQSGR